MIISLVFALLFKYIPDAEVKWKDVLIGSTITALLFLLGKLLIGVYMSHTATTNVYGAAGSLVALLLWIYYSSLIFFIGAEFTHVYANEYGSRIKPKGNATLKQS
jgi:membrane protein